MGEYIDWSARECGSECVAQIIQSSLEVTQAAQQATGYVGEATVILESVSNIINDMQGTYEQTEGQVIQLRIDVRQLSDDINFLRSSIDDSMVPTIDNSTLFLIISILGALTICLVMCLSVIGYTVYTENNNKVTIEP